MDGPPWIDKVAEVEGWSPSPPSRTSSSITEGRTEAATAAAAVVPFVSLPVPPPEDEVFLNPAPPAPLPPTPPPTVPLRRFLTAAEISFNPASAAAAPALAAALAAPAAAA